MTDFRLHLRVRDERTAVRRLEIEFQGFWKFYRGFLKFCLDERCDRWRSWHHMMRFRFVSAGDIHRRLPLRGSSVCRGGATCPECGQVQLQVFVYRLMGNDGTVDALQHVYHAAEPPLHCTGCKVPPDIGVVALDF